MRDKLKNIILPNGFTMFAPDKLDNITTYIFSEQKDWFEDEIKFLRKFFKPGMNVLDIGTSYGIYTLTMSELVFPGKVWAFEPDINTAGILKKSIEYNNLENIILEPFAFSGKSGRSVFNLSNFTELNSITAKPGLHTQKTEIDTLTLDDSLKKYNWESLDFVKIDAEGEELNIFRAGKSFLEYYSPLIMFESQNINYSMLVDELAEIGYETFQLIPHFDLLVPFNKNLKQPLLINLFCCKREKISFFENNGILIRNLKDSLILPVTNNNLWREKLTQLKFSNLLMYSWNTFPGQDSNRIKYQDILNFYFISRDKRFSIETRFASLRRALKLISEMDISNNLSRMQTAIRIISEIGLRYQAVNILKNFIYLVNSGQNISFAEPFIPVSERFENIEPEDRLTDWCMSSVYELYEKLYTYSSCFTPAKSLDNLEKMKQFNFISDEMKLRFELVSELKKIVLI